MRLQQQVGEADDGGQHVVEVVRHAAGELADRLHLVALGEFELQRLLLGGVDGIEHGALAPARAGVERAHVDAPRQLALRAEGDLDRRRAGAAGDGALQRLGELAAGLLLAVGHQAATVVGTPRPSTANMRMKAALAVTMRPSASAVAMPNGADWKTRVSAHLAVGMRSRASAPRCGRARARR